MQPRDGHKINWPIVLIFGPMLVIGLIVDMLWPQALRPYIIAVGVAWIVSLSVYLVVGSRRTQPRKPGEGS